MAGKRARRNAAAQSVLPLRSRRLSNALSICYCDVKIDIFNDFLFSFGRRHARFLRIWFAVGVVFSIVALLAVTMMLVWELIGVFYIHNGFLQFNTHSSSWLFGIFPVVSNFSFTFVDAIIMVFSTLISVAFHEFGHAIAAASVGIQIEYIAIFLAVLFPGALVAFNYDLLQSLPHFASLRIYCAGIWHNVVICAVCGLTLLLLPFILYPIYMHNEGPMVLGVPKTSPLSGYLSRDDVILSVDGFNISSPYEWVKKMAQVDASVLHNSYYSDRSGAASGRKGYCVPKSWVEASKKSLALDSQFPCPDNQAAFLSMPCLNSSLFSGNSSEVSEKIRQEDEYCLTAKDVVKRTKCGDGWQITGTQRSNSACLEEEICMMPSHIPGMSWVEISYSSPYSSECLKLGKHSSPKDPLLHDSGASPCGGSFVFIGDAVSMAHSVLLSAYRPRGAYFTFCAYIPTLVEKILSCAFHVSATLAFLNTLPVFFLDGESILETVLHYITWLNPRMRHKVQRFCLIDNCFLRTESTGRLSYQINDEMDCHEVCVLGKRRWSRVV